MFLYCSIFLRVGVIIIESKQMFPSALTDVILGISPLDFLMRGTALTDFQVLRHPFISGIKFAWDSGNSYTLLNSMFKDLIYIYKG